MTVKDGGTRSQNVIVVNDYGREEVKEGPRLKGEGEDRKDYLSLMVQQLTAINQR